jgi:hypothetical protein
VVVFQDLRVFAVTQDFPREYKFTLGSDMTRDALVLLRSMYRINKARDKVDHLEGFLDDFELLKLEIRLCADVPGRCVQNLMHNRVADSVQLTSCRKCI